MKYDRRNIGWTHLIRYVTQTAVVATAGKATARYDISDY